jgi:transcriptional regulator with XRE-family HTH domain
VYIFSKIFFLSLLKITFMSFIGSNIKFLRKQKNLTQEELSKKIGVNRSMIGSYEEGRAKPKLSSIQIIAHYFKTGVDELINKDLSLNTKPTKTKSPGKDIKGSSLRILSTIVDNENNELITVVPVKAAAGYLIGFSDPEYIEKLPKFALPLQELSPNRTYRIFQIKGNSMEPITEGSYIICEYVQDWQEIKNGKTYILLTKEEGIVYKRVYNRIEENGELILKSDNPEYEPYTVKIDNVSEAWKALGYMSFKLPEPDEVSIHKISFLVSEMKKDIEKLKSGK